MTRPGLKYIWKRQAQKVLNLGIEDVGKAHLKHHLLNKNNVSVLAKQISFSLVGVGGRVDQECNA